ncbi:MAG: hypothetical protein ACI4Q4_09150 [Oscillospiraceae bacterium]
MRREQKNIIKKRLLIGWICAVLVLLAGVGVFAAYTNLNSVKRVVSTQGGGGTAFSSNYLNLVAMHSDTYALKNISFTETGDTAAFEINVCNYVHNNPSKVNEKDITYTLNLTLVDDEGAVISSDFSGLAVSDGTLAFSFSAGKCVISGRTLTGGTKSIDPFRITVPREFIDTVGMRVVAEPDSASYQYTDNSKLGRIFNFTEFNASSVTWTGSFTESTTDGYDGFNYVIRGQGKGTVTLEWDAQNLEISRVFLENNGIAVTESGGKKQFTIDVDSNTRSRYEIQFYKTESGVYTDMETVNGYVEFAFSES